jgi:hypothetical protein
MKQHLARRNQSLAKCRAGSCNPKTLRHLRQLADTELPNMLTAAYEMVVAEDERHHAVGR